MVARSRSVKDVCCSLLAQELIHVISNYGETSDTAAARRIADAICVTRKQGLLPKRTKEFAALVARAKGVEYQAMHPAKLTFQVCTSTMTASLPPGPPQKLGVRR